MEFYSGCAIFLSCLLNLSPVVGQNFSWYWMILDTVRDNSRLSLHTRHTIVAEGGSTRRCWYFGFFFVSVSYTWLACAPLTFWTTTTPVIVSVCFLSMVQFLFRFCCSYCSARCLATRNTACGYTAACIDIVMLRSLFLKPTFTTPLPDSLSPLESFAFHYYLVAWSTGATAAPRALDAPLCGSVSTPWSIWMLTSRRDVLVLFARRDFVFLFLLL